MGTVQRLLDLLYPKKCVFCGRPLKTGEEYFCVGCGETLPLREGGLETEDVRYAESCIVPLFYQDMTRRSLLRYKFEGASYYAPIYAELLLPYIKKRVEPDAVTWVPLSAKRRRSRGYDQACELAKAISKRLGVPCVRLLDKIVDTPPQSGIKNAEERRANALGAYAPHSGADAEGLTVLIADDIVTTGSTMGECCRVLRQMGAARVFGVAVAGGRKPGKDDEEATCK